MKIVHIACIKKWKGTLSCKNSEKKNQTSHPNFCHVENRCKIQIREKVVQKCPNVFSVFYDHTWMPGSIYKLYTSFLGAEGGLGVKNCCNNTLFAISEHRNTWRSGPKMHKFFSVFYDHTWVAGSIFKSYASFFRKEGVGVVKNCCNNTFFTISEHRNTCYYDGKVGKTEKRGNWKILKRATLPFSNGMT